MDEQDGTGFKPPYLSFQTFWSFIDDLAARPLPPQIDRSMMSSKSGTDQSNLTATLKGFGLISDDQTVKPMLVDLVAGDADQRKIILAALVRQHYADALRVSDQHGTEKQLNDSFKDEFGLDAAETRRKSITFFLHAARTAGIPLSAHFPSTRSGSGAPGTPKRRATKRKPIVNQGHGAGADVPETPASGTHSTTVRLKTGGVLTLTVNVNPISLKGADREFFYKIIDEFDAYGAEDLSPENGENGEDDDVEDEVT